MGKTKEEILKEVEESINIKSKRMGGEWEYVPLPFMHSGGKEIFKSNALGICAQINEYDRVWSKEKKYYFTNPKLKWIR